MALNTKTFTWGSYAYQSESRSYVLELTLTEDSIDTENNISYISYELVLKSGSNNRFSGDVDSVLRFGGKQVASGTKRISAAYNASWTLLSGTEAVAHHNDGSLNMPIEVSINTYNSSAPPDKTLTWEWGLTNIPRASSIEDAADVVLGNWCAVKWTPNSSDHTFTLKFSLGDWEQTVPNIAPGDTGQYSQSVFLSLQIAEHFSGRTGEMHVALITYSGTSELGESPDSFTVTVPDNDETRPTVTMELSPVSPIDGVYLQDVSRVQAVIRAEAQLGADIESCSLSVQGRNCERPDLSDTLTSPGAVTVVGSVTDSHEITGTNEQTITVLPYYKPRLMGVKAYRCNVEGIPSENGEYLKIEATRDYARAVTEDGTQHNFCAISYSYRQENSEKFSEPVEILAADTESDTVETEPLLNATFSKEYGYVVQIVAEDTAGQKTVSTVQIPCERVFRHKRAGGKGLGLGGYCDRDDLLDVHWDQRIRGDLQVDGDLRFGDVPLLERVYPVGSIYMSVSDTDPGGLFGGTWERLKDRFLLAAGDTYAPGKMDGEAEHKLTVEEMPGHSHGQTSLVTGYSGWESKTISKYTTHVPYDGGEYTTADLTVNAATVYSNTNTSNTGAGKAHNNMPPYLAVYIWKRIK